MSRNSRSLAGAFVGGAALKWLCFAHDGVVPHGFRVSASTLLHELGFDPKIIEAQLAHEKVDQVAKIYNRAVYVPLAARDDGALVYVHRGVNNRCKPGQRRLTRTKHPVSL
jgi:integrase